MKTFTNWKQAHETAQALADECKRDAGILKANEFGRTVFNVILLSNPENRCGHELLAEVVQPAIPSIESVKPGTLITFVCGPGESPEPRHARAKGKAYGIRRSRWGNSLRVKMEDCSFRYVSSFTKVGIGAYCWA